jgi:hypothetical protein
MRKMLYMLAVLLAMTATLSAQQPPAYLYKVSFIQAAPGKLLEFIELQKARNANKDSGDEPAFWMRHSQGDRWDLMLVYPMGSYAEFYKLERIAKRAAAESKDRQQFVDDIAWHEDLFVYGPSLADVKKNWEGAGFFHVEIFQALPGKQNELIKEREMENAYLRKLNQPTNLVFTRDQGAAWDCFTIGFYRDLQHYAESAKSSPEDAEAAAKAAGFESSKGIGPYLRTLIALHHDTLAVAIK